MSTRRMNTSLMWWCTGVCMTGRLDTSLITSSQPLMLLLAVFVYDPLTWIVSLFLAADLVRTAVGFFITLARQSGTRCQMNLEIRTVLTFQPLTSVTTDQRSTGLLTRCLLTYLCLLTVSGMPSINVRRTINKCLWTDRKPGRFYIIMNFSHLYSSVSQKNPPLPPAACGFRTFFDKRLRILNQFFTHLLHVPIYAILQIFFQTITKLCHIKRDYLVHVIRSKCPQSAETHAFRRLRKSLVALLIVICEKSSQICCFYNDHQTCWIWHDVKTVTSFAQ